jgi:HD superfamily phosphohydrolase
MKVTDVPGSENQVYLHMTEREREILLNQAIEKIMKEKPLEQCDYLINYIVNCILRQQINETLKSLRENGGI